VDNLLSTIHFQEYIEDVDEATRQFILDQNFETRSLVKKLMKCCILTIFACLQAQYSEIKIENGLNNSVKAVHKTIEPILEKLQELSKGQIDLKNSVQQSMDIQNQTVYPLK